MKPILRHTVIYAFTLFLLPQVFSGIEVSGGFLMLLFSGFVLSLLFLILRPIINIISIPLNLATLGIFSVFTNVLILYLLTIFVPNIVIRPFTYPGITLAGFIIPKTHLGLFGAYAVIGIALSFLSNLFRWLVK